MQNRNWFKSNSQQRFKSAERTTSSSHKTQPLPAPWLCALIVIVLILSLSGCATRSPVVCPEQVIPPAPALSEPIPPESYSLVVQRLLSKWEASLTESTQTGKR